MSLFHRLFCLLCIITFFKTSFSFGDTESPNVIFILVDDLGYGDLGCYNPESKIPTPNLDKLASRGMRFTDAHSPASVCSPTRYALLTGNYSWRGPLQRGVLQSWDLPIIADEQLTLAEVFQNAGYYTAHIGKWHLGYRWKTKNGLPEKWEINHLWRQQEKGVNIDFSEGIKGGPVDVGFDYSFGFDAPNIPPYCFWENEVIIGPSLSVMKPDDWYGNTGPMQPEWQLEEVAPDLEAKVLEFIADREAQDAPFFLYFAMTSPHVPLLPTEAAMGKSDAGLYGDFVVDIDITVGKIYDKLHETGLLQNTVIIFTSDNGSPARVEDPQRGRSYVYGVGEILRQFGHKANGDMRGFKGDLWEGGHRVPMIVSWPDMIVADSINDQLVCLTDWYEFAHKITGQKKPLGQGIDSENLLNTLLDPSKKIRGDIVHHSSRGEFAIREGEWKLLLTAGGGSPYSEWFDPEGQKNEYPGRLYNLKDDPSEETNLYADYPEKVRHLTELLEQIKNL